MCDIFQPADLLIDSGAGVPVDSLICGDCHLPFLGEAWKIVTSVSLYCIVPHTLLYYCPPVDDVHDQHLHWKNSFNKKSAIE